MRGGPTRPCALRPGRPSLRNCRANSKLTSAPILWPRNTNGGSGYCAITGTSAWTSSESRSNGRDAKRVSRPGSRMAHSSDCARMSGGSFRPPTRGMLRRRRLQRGSRRCAGGHGYSAIDTIRSRRSPSLPSRAPHGIRAATPTTKQVRADVCKCTRDVHLTWSADRLVSAEANSAAPATTR